MQPVGSAIEGKPEGTLGRLMLRLGLAEKEALANSDWPNNTVAELQEATIVQPAMAIFFIVDWVALEAPWVGGATQFRGMLKTRCGRGVLSSKEKSENVKKKTELRLFPGLTPSI
jgi:hypothetical protein